MDVELTWIDADKPIDMEEVERTYRESLEDIHRWEAGEFTPEELEEFEEYALAQDASLRERFVVGAYLLLRQGDTWRHGLELDTISIKDGKWANPGRHRALFDRRWLLHTDTDLWHESMLKVLEWMARYDVDPAQMLTWLMDDQPRVETWLSNFRVNVRRRRWRTNKEDPSGTGEGYTRPHNDPERTREVEPAKGFRVPPAHSWRHQFYAYEPWEALDLSMDVRSALAKLPEVDRRLFIQHHAYGATIKSLAVDIPLGTVNKKLTTAMRKVRDLLNETPPKRRGRPPKKSITTQEIGYSIDPNSGLTIYTPPWGVADATLSRRNPRHGFLYTYGE